MTAAFKENDKMKKKKRSPLRFSCVPVFGIALFLGCHDEKNGADDPTDAGDTDSNPVTCVELACAENATCIEGTGGANATCTCNDGYLGDGDVCDLAGLWEPHLIGTQENAIYVVTADFDGDLDLDVAVTSSNHDSGYAAEVAWYRNDGAGQSFTKFVVSEATSADPIIAANGVDAADVNGDGAIDLAVASGPVANKSGGVYLLESPADPTNSNEWVRIDLLETAQESFYKIYFEDLDGDTYPDIVAGGSDAGALIMNPGLGSGAWTVYRLNAGTGGGLFVGDVNGDFSPDIVNASGTQSKVSWTSVSFDAGTPAYVDRFIGDLSIALDVNLLDIDEDGLNDVLASRISGRGFRWFKQPANDADPWIERMIRDQFSGTDIFVGDVDGDGSDDVLISGLAMMEADKLPPSVAWFSRTVAQGEVTWSVHWVDYDNPNLTVPGDNELADMNGDGALDVVVTSVTGNSIYWYENKIGR